MIGMALVGGIDSGPRAGIRVRDAMGRWAIYLVLFGFLRPLSTMRLTVQDLSLDA